MGRKPLIRSLLVRNVGLLVVEFLCVALVTAVGVGYATAAARAANPEYFPRNLAEGDEGADVFNLQIALNSDARTQVAADGPGAPGQETGYFGAKTAAALARYQEIKAITPADGSAESKTRAALNATLIALSGEGAAQATTTGGSSTVAGALGAFPKDFQGFFSGVGGIGPGGGATPASQINVFATSPATVQSGKKMSVFGYGFSQGTPYDLVLASTGEVVASGVATTSISVDFKKFPKLSPGQYAVQLRGAGGTSNQLTVYVGSGHPPVVTSVTPNPIKAGDEVTVFGTGFSPTGNSVQTALGTIDNLKMEKVKGKAALVFTSELGANLPLFVRSNATTSVPVSLTVVNAKGASQPVLVDVAL
jgi:hypothetical protein